MNLSSSSRRFPVLGLAAGLALCLGACSSEAEFTAAAREAGDRTPITAACDDADPTRCLLPWPSNTFTKLDPTSPTGLRLAVEASSLLSEGDDPASLNLADGFSRVSPIVTMFSSTLSDVPPALDGGGPLRLIVAQHDAADRGTLVPLSYMVSSDTNYDGELESLLAAYPLTPLAPSSDYVAVVMDDVPTASPETAPRHTRVVLGLVAPESQAEADLYAYHAPTRAVLAEANVDAQHVLRVWDFTTRSEQDPRQRLSAMRAASTSAVANHETTATIDVVELRADGPVAAVVEGHLSGLPLFVEDGKTGGLVLDAAGLPTVVGTHDAPFRVTIPAGTGDYRLVMFGHGTGGSFRDDAFDDDLAALGVAKASIQFYGWTDEDTIATFTGFTQMSLGSYHSTAWLMQAIADGAAIEAALPGSISDLLAADELGDEANPAAGRRPHDETPIWVGGSLGGTMGAVYTGSSPVPHDGVFNVGGAAWTHFIPASKPFKMIQGLLTAPYEGFLNVLVAMAVGQGNWDEVDGASWGTSLSLPDSAFLIQESIGDPVLPNAGTDMLARLTGAKLVGAPLVPIAGVSGASSVSNASGITQYHVDDTGAYDVHGFAAKDTPAGAAAREQILSFLTTVWAEAPLIVVPESCPDQRCDFTTP